ncbi:MAG: hypothetical protein Q8R69_06070 [Telluria sp.]|nr:hypothetical protein [Telluria sp.]
MKIPKFALAACLVFANAAAMGAEQSIICPAELQPESLQFRSAPAGWMPTVSSPLYLHDAAPISGPPERLGTMVGKMVKQSKTEWTETYSLDGVFPDGKWFKCDYGVGNEFSLSKKLDDSVKACVVKGRKGSKFGQHAFDIKCH